MPVFHRNKSSICIGQRETTFQNSGAKLTTTDLKHIDLKLNDDINIPEPHEGNEKHFAAGKGEISFAVTYQEKTIAKATLLLAIQSAVGLYLALGDCATVGSDYDPAKTDIVSNVSTTLVTLTTGGLTIDAHIGDQLEITSGTENGNTYAITDNTADTLTLEQAPPTLAASDTVKITTAPFTHTISEKRFRPTFPVHLEQLNDSESIYADLLGCILEELQWDFPKLRGGNQDWEVHYVKNILADSLTMPAANSVDALSFAHLGTTNGNFSMTYDSANPISLAEIQRIRFKIRNTSSFLTTWGDIVRHLKRNFTIIFDATPFKKTLFDLRETQLGDYATDLTLTLKFAWSATLYIQISWTKLRLTEYPNEIPNPKMNAAAIEIQFTEAPGCVTSAIAVDELNKTYYERTN